MPPEDPPANPPPAQGFPREQAASTSARARKLPGECSTRAPVAQLGHGQAELEAGTPAVETKGRLALANVNSFRMAADVTRQLFDLIGANVIFQGSTLERLARDALTLNQHMIIAQPAVETYGAMMLGYEHPSPLY